MNISRGGAVRAAVCSALPALAVILALGAIGAVTASARAFPIPSCGWAPSAVIGKTFKDPVRAAKPVWITDFAPILSCRYIERRRKLQLGSNPIVTVRYAEDQRFSPLAGSTFVRGLGSCIRDPTCPRPHKPAWLYVRWDVTAPGAGRLRFVSGVDLRVQDGLNAIEIIVDNSGGPLAVVSEAGQVERLARELLPKFSWT
ncbi:MAG: hypothetical protein ACLP8S_29620 [Solirubrobacteraceae bacterium]